MKNIKKLASLLLVMVMVLTLTAAAFADETTTHTITITNENTGHTYNAYQVFVGTVSVVDDTMMLTDIQWGSGVDSAGLLAALKVANSEKYSSCETADDVANVLKDRGAQVDAFAKLVSQHLATVAGSANAPTAGTGYVINVTGDGYYFVKDADAVTGNDAATKYMLRVAKDVIVGPKASVPTMEKKVQDTNDSTGASTGWQDSADYDIGDSVPFRLSATVGDNFNAYTKYKLVFHDTESAGLTFIPDSVKVYVGGTPVDTGYEVVSPTTDGHTFDVVFNDLKEYGEKVAAGTVIRVEYLSTLNEGAAIGATGNPNKACLEFSNNPYDENHTGTTPDDTVIVFTYKTIINKVRKVEGANQPLAGAEFTLEKYVNDAWVSVAPAVKNGDGTTFTFSGLDDGRYRLHESKTPIGYNSIEDIYFTITATHDIESDNPGLLTLGASENETNSATSKPDGLAFTPNVEAGSVSADVLNNAGTTLPTTGGIGTTLFYVIGSVLVLAAVVLLVTKKRMSAQN